MYVEIDLGSELPAGYVTKSAKKGERVSVAIRGFLSTADGQLLVQLLEQLPSQVLSKLPGPPAPSQVDNLLVVIRPGETAQVYINEVSTTLTVRAKRPVEKGQPVMKDDIADIKKMELVDIDVPTSAGILYIFSIGWRRGLYFDFGPLIGENKQLRTYDLARALGGVYTQVLFQERFSISDAEWSALFAAQWFPFIGLSHGIIERLISHVQAGWDPNELLDDIVAEVSSKVTDMLSSWSGHPAFTPHFKILKSALDRFRAGDYISCTTTLYTRIEGLLRTHHRSVADPSEGCGTTRLASSAVSGKSDAFQSLVLPHRFEDYLNEFYFRNFDPKETEIEVSRHSVSHGEASAEKFNNKSSVLGILVIHQLYYAFDIQAS